MFINELDRHLSVSSIPELEKSLKFDNGFWNVVSIREPQVPRPAGLRFAKRFHEALCEDLETADSESVSRPPRSEDVAGIFKFVDSHPGEPVLVHCLAGLSRSPAVALGFIVRGMIEKGWSVVKTESLVEHAAGLLLQIRPKARPNVLFLRLCLEQYLPEKQAIELAAALAKHPVLMRNRFITL